MRYFLWVGLLLGSFCLRGQSVSLNYNDVFIGWNAGLLFHTGGEQQQFYAGIKWHYNDPNVHDNQQDRLFMNRGHASSFREHLGLQLGYNRLLRINDRASLLLFYDAQLSSTGTWRTRYVPVAEVDDEVLYTPIIIEYEEIKTLEQSLGLGIRAELLKNIYLNMKLGGTLAFLWELPTDTNIPFISGKKTALRAGHLISVGLEYDLWPNR